MATIVPLLSVFTPPSSCSSHWTYEASHYNGVSGGLLIQNAIPTHPDGDCFPPGFAGAGRVPHDDQIFSPGACPSGYSTAALFQSSETTSATCCQSWVVGCTCRIARSGANLSRDFHYYTTIETVALAPVGITTGTTITTTALFAGCLSTYSSGRRRFRRVRIKMTSPVQSLRARCLCGECRSQWPFGSRIYPSSLPLPRHPALL
jgi:hypothetical protein